MIMYNDSSVEKLQLNLHLALLVQIFPILRAKVNEISSLIKGEGILRENLGAPLA